MATTAKRSPGKRRPAAGAGSSIGAAYGTFLDQLALIEAGLPATAIAAFGRATGLSVARITAVAGISAGTYSRRRHRRKLSPGESERMLRLSRVFERAVDLFRGDAAAARQWLETPVPSLGGRRPLDLARTEPGAAAVDDLIGRVQHGVVA